MREQHQEIRKEPPTATGASRVAGWIARSEAKRLMLLATVPGLIFAVLGPLGSYEAPFILRLLYWVPTMALGTLIGGAISGLVLRHSPSQANQWLRVGFISTATTIAMTLVVTAMSWLVFGPHSPGFSVDLIFYVWVITLAMSAIGMLSQERRQRVEAAQDHAAPPQDSTPPPLYLRLPVRFQDHVVLALQAEDHYVRVHTALGSELILIRISDAIREMGNVRGARTHRSWWVAKSAVASLSRAEGRLTLQLTNGLTVPVSRNYATELKEAGWLNS